MNTVKDTFFEGERPLFGVKDYLLNNVKFYPGESAIKHAQGVTATHCEFLSKYPFWHNQDIVIEESTFTTYGRAAIWYTDNVIMRRCKIDAPKMFREVKNLLIEDTNFSDAQEFIWNCSNVRMRNVTVKKGDYIFMNGKDIEIDNLTLQGNYSFQDAKNVVIRNSHFDSKDAFWNTENVTVYDSVLDGEYLGWHSKNLRLVNCVIRGTQPLCYAENLIMENCTMGESADLGFEYSTVNAEIVSDLINVKNPKGGTIRARSIGEIIIDEFCVNPGACDIRSSESEAQPA